MNGSRLGVITTICFSCFILNQSIAQSKQSNCSGVQDTILHKFVYTSVDKMPEPIGGIIALSKSLSKQLKYSSAREEPIGRVIVAFVVEKNGTIRGGRIVRDFSDEGYFFGKQILIVVKHSKWKPGLCNGKQVAVLYTLPINIDSEE
jgi:hypothetical protein